ncbi:Uncharacterised protein [Mycobacteroides abscessus subsp. abscessus]|uniref:hypothetical protein n=1 Tax=Mycobacteroides abscessus TaxID=36809 RepID=UPI000927E553|nr:hypothetical protein [Mycobacteroides abscessus]SIJ02175.1 Uncharacterised protein [Mycobacteroides abscessus subsp. abscessus]SIN14755.1 Uncharacterised protein [Mycobacteroides abscessus subsp. abscessus]
MALDREQSDREFVDAVMGSLQSFEVPPVHRAGGGSAEVVDGEVVSVTDQPCSDESVRLPDAELDALPEYVLDERRDIVWQLCADGRYTMLATGDPVVLDREATRSLAQLRATVGSVLVPLRTDERARDARTGLLSESPQ